MNNQSPAINFMFAQLTGNMKKDLTGRELEVLSLIVKEFTSKEIAKKLDISKQTVDTHRINIMHKTGAKTIVGLVKYALQAGLD